ncbi:O-methyltransferase [Williamsia sp. CHRR-6]|uniref:O-methyltransferase n=1 Tax=Williamsia sp. CHRR-6 TaxID=2835871 RepID=UPI001BDAB679|nr:class I SAM-dependent methyltransferase [Williamsia sp. CHRR-6]MBT0565193.1 class I SAM-dependent methyltransferase [Williamsia sp. CHRR-6]
MTPTTIPPTAHTATRPGSPPGRPVTPSTIIAAEIGALRDELSVAGHLTPELGARLDRLHRLAAGLEPYVGECTSPPSRALTQLAHRTAETPWFGDGAAAHVVPLEQEMLSGHVEGALLGFLVAMSQARRILEVGMFTGYATLAMAQALDDDGTVVACELDPAVAEFARAGFAASPAGQKISVHVGPAGDTLTGFAAQPPAERPVFDLVFIDADKPGYLGYLETILSGGLLAEHGTVVVDNTLMQGEPYLDCDERSPNGEAIAAFNAAVRDDPRVVQVLLPIRDGVTLIRRRPEASTPR